MANNRLLAKQLVFDLFELKGEGFNLCILVFVFVFQFLDPLLQFQVLFFKRSYPFSGLKVEMFKIGETNQSLFDFFCGEYFHFYILSCPIDRDNDLVVRGVDTYISNGTSYLYKS